MIGRFSNQIVVVTGASSGIGKAIAVEMATQGAVLCLVGRRLETLKAIAQTVQETSPRSKSYQVDLACDEDIQKLIVSIQQDFGQVDILIHNAGIFSMGAIATTPVAEFDQQYRTNVRAPYLLTQALLPILKIQHGQIVFINSNVRASANLGHYAATKHALKAIADSLREEVNIDQVRVISVFPGSTATPLQAKIHEMEGKIYYPERLIQPEDVATVVINALSLPPTAEVTDISIRPFTKPLPP
ncbi:SDR family NAD(P)-dependent oxidoreductase [Nostoc sp. KVJ3]|uniref:SDR family NAD(P)-dependent oxidoreductase n=1 Tax=Nostoc sp. KVJ3 TaxID=457945 RepID=UPI0022378E2B|nr:SDR family NAD(P)-dependent oxidoreductase [Nostoc sp. KVJ3]MCW5315428.1 SDR family NAD(P)-dependent oxidoreductase [Nostoc sp. KVJ3]